MNELKPCPFCGDVAYYDAPNHHWQSISCRNENCDCCLSGDTKELATKAWNTRTDSTLLSELVGALEEVGSVLMNMQPHIQQACERGDAAFIDNYVDAASGIINAALQKAKGV